MSAQGLFSIGGLASGLDTSNIISQLMKIERQPVVRMESTQAQLRQVDGAWNQVNTKLSALRTAVDKINRRDRFTSMVAVTSSNSDAVSVTRGTGTTTGTLSFRVDQLAQSAQMASGDFAATDTPLAAGTFEVAIGGQTTTVELDGTQTLSDLVAKLNAAEGGFTASTVKIADGQYRVLLTGDDSGAGNDLAVTSTLAPFGAGQTTNLRTARDAQVTLGTGVDAITISRASNTITDLVPGASVTLNKTTADEVTVTSSRDVEAAVRAVNDYVTALNGAIDTLKSLTAYDAETNTAGLLQGDATARQLMGQLRSSAVTSLGVPREPFSNGYEVGLSVDRYGKAVLDETKLRDALAEDFDAVGRVFGRAATVSEPSAVGMAGSTATADGNYEVEVTTAATAAKAVGATYDPPGAGEPKTFRVISGGRTATVTIDTTHLSAADVIAEINEALEASDLGYLSARAGEGGEGDLVIESSDYGSKSTFTIEEMTGAGEGATVVPGGTAWGLEGTYTGTDASGRIRPVGGDWSDLTGSGQTLTASEGPGEGIKFVWTADAASTGAFGVAFTQGLGGQMDATLRSAEGSSGSVARARTGISNQISMYDTRIEGFEHRLTLRESTLIRQFTAMETAMSRMNSQMSWLSSQLSSLNGMNER
ncbi:MAG TPA: flagellar filament capping protein FliD [Egicoccus sp.]|nr:flagellar filament capping protein FliD [Egicoccus sp.]HSK21921.1 flagellar filament capping protein FliD [Egicoccus sp.]